MWIGFHRWWALSDADAEEKCQDCRIAHARAVVFFSSVCVCVSDRVYAVALKNKTHYSVLLQHSATQLAIYVMMSEYCRIIHGSIGLIYGLGFLLLLWAARAPHLTGEGRERIKIAGTQFWVFLCRAADVAIYYEHYCWF